MAEESIARGGTNGAPSAWPGRRACWLTASALLAFLLFDSHGARAAGRTVRSTSRRPPVQQPSRNNAESLLAEGKRLMAARQYAVACPKIQESQRLAPATATLLELAICHEKHGKTATAWRELNAVIRQGVGTDSSSKTARSHLNALEPQVSRLTVRARPGVDTSGIQFAIDGLPMEDSAWGTPIPVDPGSHSVVVSIGGARQWSGSVNVGEHGDRQTVDVPVGRPTASPAPQTPAEPEKSVPVAEKIERPPLTEPPKEEDEPERRPSRPHRPVMGYVMLGAGLAGIGVGSYFGLHAISLRKDSDAGCVRGCTQSAVDLNNDAKTAAWASNIGIGVGALVFGIGSYLLLKPLSPAKTDTVVPEEKPDSASLWLVPEIAPAGAGASFGGAW